MLTRTNCGRVGVVAMLTVVGALLVMVLAHATASQAVPLASPADYLITERLPNYDGPWPLSYSMYSGYLTVDQEHGRNIFFWFVESENNPENDPLVLWLQGGPGCSGMFGLTAEHGPIVANSKTGGMSPNYFAWNRVANILYIDAPAGVGFSYSMNASDYNTNDNKTADDNYIFLQKFFEVFTSHRRDPLWIAGESYGGVYAPMLVYRILTGSDSAMKSQLKGMILGNPVIDCKDYGINTNPLSLQVSLFFWHAVISYSSFREFEVAGCNDVRPPNPSLCDELYRDMKVNVHDDDLYWNSCIGNGTLNILDSNKGCVTPDSVLNSWLNAKEAQSVIHARPVEWMECTNKINYTTSNPSMITYLRYFIQYAPRLQMLYYSGDVDIATVPHAYTQFCLATLNRPITKKWRPYYIPGNQQNTAGYVEVTDKYTFATVIGAGHEAPMFQPAKAYHLFSNFIRNGAIP
eukprot:TRINITY_DN3174_c1_g1_i3.p1 TRINITY_DN3174_c1_g1~~TRINITY_DN3174_c1_g1_i3.p1  ORF type:complete len:463 (+),score=51.42 TRINITY_DN3174_c1_g1_i3:205-1593(+)